MSPVSSLLISTVPGASQLAKRHLNNIVSLAHFLIQGLNEMTKSLFALLFWWVSPLSIVEPRDWTLGIHDKLELAKLYHQQLPSSSSFICFYPLLKQVSLSTSTKSSMIDFWSSLIFAQLYYKVYFGDKQMIKFHILGFLGAQVGCHWLIPSQIFYLLTDRGFSDE